MNKIFEKYIQSVAFDGKFYFLKFKALDKNYGITEFKTLVNWYHDEENSDVIESILDRNDVNVFANLKEKIQLFRKERESIKSKAPSMASFEYIGMFHEH